MDDAPDWEPFSDLLEPGDVPTFGFRVLLRIGADGEMHTDYAYEGEKIQAYLAVGAVQASVFEFFHDHLHEHGNFE